MANRMILNETSYFGAGSISAIVDEAKARAFKKILVVTDPSLVKFGVSTKVTKLLDEANICTPTSRRTPPSPTFRAA